VDGGDLTGKVYRTQWQKETIGRASLATRSKLTIESNSEPIDPSCINSLA